jgi:hypothetical protein
MLPYMEARLDLPLLPALLAQDAAGAGDGGGSTGSFVLALGLAALDTVEGIWAAREVRGAVVGNLADGPITGPTRPGALGVIDRIAGPVDGRLARQWIPVTAVPVERTLNIPWFHILSGPWRWKDHINLGEGRGPLLWLALLWKCAIFGFELPDISDNRVTLGVYGKGRSSPWRTNHIARQRAGYEAVSGNRMGVSWEPTYLMAADEGTRSDGEISMNRNIFALRPPKAIVLDLSGGSWPDPLSSVKWYRPKWDLATPRGRGRLGAALWGGGVRAVLFELIRCANGTLDVTGPEKARVRPRDIESHSALEAEAMDREAAALRISELLALVKRLGNEIHQNSIDMAGAPALLLVLPCSLPFLYLSVWLQCKHDLPHVYQLWWLEHPDDTRLVLSTATLPECPRKRPPLVLDGAPLRSTSARSLARNVSVARARPSRSSH